MVGGYLIRLAGGPIPGRSCWQKAITLFSAEAELTATIEWGKRYCERPSFGMWSYHIYGESLLKARNFLLSADLRCVLIRANRRPRRNWASISFTRYLLCILGLWMRPPETIAPFHSVLDASTTAAVSVLFELPSPRDELLTSRCGNLVRPTRLSLYHGRTGWAGFWHSRARRCAVGRFTSSSLQASES